MKKSAAIIIGASGGLGLALCKEWQKDKAIGMVIAISRSDLPPDESRRHRRTDLIFDSGKPG